MRYGYGLKLIFDENLNSELHKYFSLYSALEIKFKQNLINSTDLIAFINSKNELYNHTISFHVEADLIENYSCRKQYFLRFLKVINNVNLIVTHLPLTITNNIKDTLIDICDSLPKNCIILLENSNLDVDFFDNYLKIKKMLTIAYKKKIKICFDLGHYDDLSKALELLKNNKIINKDIIEIHLHSKFPEKHSKFTANSYEVSIINNIITECTSLQRIILEVKNIDVLNDGHEQIDLFNINGRFK